MIESLAVSIARACRDFGPKAALVCENRVVTYAELDRLIGAFASGLKQHEAGEGSRILLHMANGWPWVVAFHATMRIGAVVVPVNALLTPDEVQFIAGHSRATHAILDAPRCSLAKSLKETLGIVGIVDGVEGAVGSISFRDLLSSASDETIAPTAPESLAAVAYTSGTTGRPKGAMLSQRALVLNSCLTHLMHGRTDRDVVVSALPLPHVYGNVVLNATLRSGGTLVLFPSFDCERIWDALDRHGATMFEGVPTMYYYLLADQRAKSGRRLRLCTVGGQTMPVDKMQAAEALFGCPLIELWGMTELAGLGTTHPHTGPRRYGSIGTALPFLDVRIAEPGSTSEAAQGSVGELLVRGPQTMLGYLDDETATAEAKTADGWLHTGDLAYRDADGFVFVVDRIKDMILTAGYNVYPAELERAIAAHPSVAMVAVGRRADPLKGEIAAAYIVLKPGAEVSEQDIETHCRKLLAAYKIPRRIRFVQDLPKTSTGKILRRSLAEIDPL